MLTIMVTKGNDDLSNGINRNITTELLCSNSKKNHSKSVISVANDKIKSKYSIRKSVTNQTFLNKGYNDSSSFNMDTLYTSNNSFVDNSNQATTYNIDSVVSKQERNSYDPDENKFYSDKRFLTVNNNKFETVSLSELDNVTDHLNHVKSFKLYKTKLKTKIQSKLLNQKCHNMERLVNKNGQANINRINIESRRRKYISDLFNTIVDMTWSYILFVFVMSFVISWTFFGTLWFVISNLSNRECITNINANSTFFESFLFSIETQQTIGYGFRYITHDCKITVIVLMVQCAFSVFLESFLGGVVFAKLSRPKKRTETLIFSKQAVIAPRDGVYNLMVRVGDLRKSHIILAYVKMYLIRTRFTAEGEYIPCEIQELAVNLSNTDLLLFMPIVVAHKIDETSPLFEMIQFSNFKPSFYANEFVSNDFEILVTLEGTVESTGVTTQARTSILPSEVLWNHVFEPLLSVSNNNSKATIDFSLFNNTKRIDDLLNEVESKRKYSIYSNNFCEKNINEKKKTSPFLNFAKTIRPKKKEKNYQVVKA